MVQINPLTMGSSSEKLTLFVTETPKFDLNSYISNYRGRIRRLNLHFTRLTRVIGRTVFRRLHLIASCSTVLQEEAARMAVVEAKKGSDLRNYHEAVALLKKASKGKKYDNLLDPTWALHQEKKNNAE